MTPEHVISLADRKAREEGVRWTLIHDAKIRTQTMCCPLEWLAGTGPQSYNRAVVALGLGNAMRDDRFQSLRRQIIGAADNNPNYADVRALMLATFDFGGEVAQ